MESEPVGKNIFLFTPDNETFEWTRDIIKSPYDHDLHSKIVDKANQIEYEIYNDFIAYLLNSFINEKKRTRLEIEISPYDEDVNVDEKYRDDAISNLSEVFKSGYYKGIDFFKSNRKEYYLKIMANGKDDFVNDFIADLFNEKYGYYFDDQMDYEEYIRNIPLCFDERTIFNHGFINGVYSSFDQFKYLMPYSIRSKVFDYIESPNTSNKTDKESIKQRFNNIPKDYYVVVELFATNEIIKKNGFFYFNNQKYSSGSSLNDAINKHFEFEKKLNNAQYLTDFKEKGERDILQFSTKKLLSINRYLDDKNVNVKNTDLENAFDNIENK